MGTAAMRTPTLVGVGVGPGDPELVTVKAIAALARADVILVPATETSAEAPGRAEGIVLAACPAVADRLRRVPFRMSQRHGIGAERTQAWRVSARAVVEAFETGASTVAFATVGDPSVYSTFSYLAAQVRARVPGLIINVVPGITAMQALAAASRTPLVEGQESLTLIPATAGVGAVATGLQQADTVVVYKGGRCLAALLAMVRQHGRDGVLGVNVGLPDEAITPLADATADAAPYFATVLVAPSRAETGGRL